MCTCTSDLHTHMGVHTYEHATKLLLIKEFKIWKRNCNLRCWEVPGSCDSVGLWDCTPTVSRKVGVRSYSIAYHQCYVQNYILDLTQTSQVLSAGQLVPSIEVPDRKYSEQLGLGRARDCTPPACVLS